MPTAGQVGFVAFEAAGATAESAGPTARTGCARATTDGRVVMAKLRRSPGRELLNDSEPRLEIQWRCRLQYQHPVVRRSAPIQIAKSASRTMVAVISGHS